MFRRPDVFPNVHGPDNQHAIVTGWALDYAATDPTFIVGLMNWWGAEKSGYSTDGGKMWKSFAEYPPGIDNKIGEGIAASTQDSVFLVPYNNAIPYYTTNGGARWIPTTIPGVPAMGETG